MFCVYTMSHFGDRKLGTEDFFCHFKCLFMASWLKDVHLVAQHCIKKVLLMLIKCLVSSLLFGIGMLSSQLWFIKPLRSWSQKQNGMSALTVVGRQKFAWWKRLAGVEAGTDTDLWKGGAAAVSEDLIWGHVINNLFFLQ